MLIHRQLTRFKKVLEYFSVFSDVQSARTYRKLLYSPEELPEKVELAMRALDGERVICRKHTADMETLWETFWGQYHLPCRRLSKPACIVDLGANVGYTVAHFGHLYPEARILAVEMDLGNVELCLQNTARLGPRVAIVQAAIWSSDGFVRYGGNEVNGLSVSREAEIDNPLAGRAPSRTLRSVFDAYRVEKVDFLKMDIEGAEAEVLRGVGEWGHCVEQIAVEIHPPAEYESCRSLLEGCGFVCEASTRRSGALTAYRPA
jgi:FkbM family methyltransferase